ncbi:chaplin [Streptomyces sp. NPDC048483]|uniref:chaplin n=1 Tax=Streptomyces sp. NPDC048483 TaxID=3154927 RepID=UPI00343F9B63
MKLVSKAVVLSAAAGVAVVGGAGIAAAGGHGGAHASGGAAHSPGVVSGNVIQVPIDIPINVCGNSINGGGLLNAAFGNKCINA